MWCLLVVDLCYGCIVLEFYVIAVVVVGGMLLVVLAVLGV